MIYKTYKYPVLFLLIVLSINAFAGGILIVSPSGSKWTATQRMYPFSLQVKSLHIESTIKDNVAHTIITQVFHNPTTLRLQGYFLFPVPENSVISNFQIDINGKLSKAELLDATQARKLYEDIVRKTLDPALLEYANNRLFKIRVFPIEAGKDKTIKIEYNSMLEAEGQLISYNLPLNTQKFSASPLKDVSLHIKISNSSEIANVYSPTHQIEEKAIDAKHWEIGFEQKEIKPNHDFKLYIQRSLHSINISALGYKGDEVKGFIMLNIAPDFYKNQTEAKDYIFVLDVSGSMRDQKIIQARKALQYCVLKLKKEDNFQLIKFSTFAEKAFPKLLPATESNKKAALAKIENWEALGGTNMEAAFKLALDSMSEDSRKKVVIFITDGKPTIGEIDENKLLQIIQNNNSKHLRIFPFGIGNDLNTLLLDKIALKTNAYRSYINENEKINLRIASFFDKVSRPAISNLKLKVEGGNIDDLVPAQIPDLFYGQNMILVGRTNKESSFKITLQGELKGKQVSNSQQIKLKFSDENNFIPQIWASRQLGYLLEQIRLKGESKELKDEIVHLAKKYGIITPYTSYLILEDEAITNINPHPYPVIRFEKNLNNTFNMEEAEIEYKDMQKPSAKNSKQSSIEIQQLNKAKTYNYSSLGQSRILKDKKQSQTFYQNRQGRAFYKNNNYWQDTQLSEEKEKQVWKIKFASTEYFKLLGQKPEIGKYMSIGKNCRFIFQKQVYQIEE